MMVEERSNKKRNTAIVVGLIAFVGILVIVIGLIAIVGPEYKKVNFTPKNWAQCDQKERYKMVNSLFKKHDLVGLTEEEVRELLGRPNASFKLNGAVEAYEYNVSKEGRKWTVLGIGFDEDGRVYDAGYMDSMR